MPEKFKIDDSIASSQPWGEVDKGRIWQLLKQGLQEGAEGVREAIREVYAVVKAEINEDLREEDCWGPHHEIKQDGTVVLNRDGLIRATQALAGARLKQGVRLTLTAEQKRQAARHLLRHYRQLEMEPPESLLETAGAAGEIHAVQAVISGEMRVEDVPLAPWANLEALKAGDPEPMEVVVEIPAGKSKRGWYYRPEALQKIVGEVMSQGLPGFLGHQKPEEVDHAFPTPVTHWVGALWKDGKAYFRGVIDKAASDLKRWIKANVVRTVSIFGVPKLQQVAGETHVVDYKPLSIDWTPLGRAGMPTAVVAIGEMDEIVGGEQKPMSWKELIGQLKDMLAKGEVTKELLIGEIDAGLMQEHTKAVEILAKVKEVLGVVGEMDVVRVATEAREALEAKRRAEREKMIDEVLQEKVAGEMAQALVRKMLQVPAGATKEQIAGEIDKLLADGTVKAALGKFYVDKPPVIGGSKGSTTLRIKRQAI